MDPEYRRTTITVPIDLKERMKKARAHVNWSAVACDAFEKKLEDIGPIEEIVSIDGALIRMKGAKNQLILEREPSRTGNEAGKHWALNYAIPSQLVRIEGLRNEMNSHEWVDLMTSRDGPNELARCMEPDGGTMRAHRPPPKRRRPGREGPPRRGGRRTEWENHGPGWEREFWRSILDDRPESPEFFLGFAEGALEIWHQIKDQL